MIRLRSTPLLAALLGLLLLPLAPAVGQDNAAAPAAEPEAVEALDTGPGPEREIVIGAGSVAGTYFPVAGAICRMVAARGAGFRCLVESNANTSANIERLRDGRLDFAVVQSDWLMHAARGTNIFRPDGPDETLRAVMALQAETVTLIARTDRQIDSLSDLAGKKINLGPPLTYPRILAGALLEAADIDQNDLGGVTEMSLTDQFSALCLGEIDVAVAVIAHPSPVLAGALARCDLHLVPVGAKAVTKLLKARPELSKAAIPGGVYVGIPDAVPSFGLRAVLATTTQIDDEIVDALVRSVLLSLDEFRRQHPVLAAITPQEMISAGIALPLHDRAVAGLPQKGGAPQ